MQHYIPHIWGEAVASLMIFGIEHESEMPPRKQVDIGELYEVVEELAKRETVSVSAMARMLLRLAIPRYENPTKISPQEVQENFDDWGTEQVIQLAIACLHWLTDKSSTEVKSKETVKKPNSIAEVVQQNFWTLHEHNIKNIDAIAKGAAPTKADIMRISSILNLDQGELLKLAKKV